MLIVSGIPDSSEPRIPDSQQKFAGFQISQAKISCIPLREAKFCSMMTIIFFSFVCFFVFFALSARETFNSFSEEKFCEYMKRATLRGEEFAKHREAIRELLTN